MNIMAKRIFIIIVALSAVLLIARGNTVIPLLQNMVRFSRDQLAHELAVDVTRLEEAAREIIAPPPLRRALKAPTTLTANGTIEWTNAFRADNNLPALKENALLGRAARAKLDDMFTHQYFEHVSPLGVDVGELAEGAGYAYVVVGENLALGDYENDHVLVAAWMDSPGHRANILHERYTEIGVAVGKGMFEGVETWLAVQEFGHPLSACPQPSPALALNIEGLQEELEVLKFAIDEERSKLEAERDKQSQAFRDAAEAYNALVNQYNELVKTSKTLVDSYNGQVKQFNACVAG